MENNKRREKYNKKKFKLIIDEMLTLNNKSVAVCFVHVAFPEFSFLFQCFFVTNGGNLLIIVKRMKKTNFSIEQYGSNGVVSYENKRNIRCNRLSIRALGTLRIHSIFRSRQNNEELNSFRKRINKSSFWIGRSFRKNIFR